MHIYFPHPPGSGGPGSFQIRFEGELRKRGFIICYPNDQHDIDFIFVVGGTKRILWLLKMKLKGVPILYRLDGINWLHRKKNNTLQNYISAELRNMISKFIHGYLADSVIYQSKFVENWWNKSGWRKKINSSIIYNGVEIPKEKVYRNDLPDIKRLVILEGTIDYSPYAIKLINELAKKLPYEIDINIYGRFQNPMNEKNIHSRIHYNGFLERNKVFEVLRGSVYLSLDINPACPNTVIEAMACGAPVVAFDTGALSEIVINGAGEIVPYGSDPWKLGYPDSLNLIKRIEMVFDDYQSYSKKAICVAEENFGLEKMVDSYIHEIQSLTK